MHRGNVVWVRVSIRIFEMCMRFFKHEMEKNEFFFCKKKSAGKWEINKIIYEWVYSEFVVLRCVRRCIWKTKKILKKTKFFGL